MIIDINASVMDMQNSIKYMIHNCIICIING